jgi:hypothetical protein
VVILSPLLYSMRKLKLDEKSLDLLNFPLTVIKLSLLIYVKRRWRKLLLLLLQSLLM